MYVMFKRNLGLAKKEDYTNLDWTNFPKVMGSGAK